MANLIGTAPNQVPINAFLGGAAYLNVAEILSMPYVDISANTVATRFRRYRLTASLDLTLPPTPSDGDWVEVANTSGTTTARVLRNGQNIGGLAEDVTIDALNVVPMFIFRAGYGWIIK